MLDIMGYVPSWITTMCVPPVFQWGIYIALGTKTDIFGGNLAKNKKQLRTTGTRFYTTIANIPVKTDVQCLHILLCDQFHATICVPETSIWSQNDFRRPRRVPYRTRFFTNRYMDTSVNGYGIRTVKKLVLNRVLNKIRLFPSQRSCREYTNELQG